MDEKLYGELIRLGVHPDCVDALSLSREIREHMDMGLRGIEGSMMMLPTYLFARGKIVQGKPVAVIDAGGTNLRAASVVFSGDGAEILEQRKYRMPGTDGSVSAEEMYDEFVRLIMPLMPENGRLALCFSYAFSSLPDGEAQIIAMGKEVSVEDCEGSLIREGMLKAFSKAGYKRTPNIIVLNDTAAVLYSALAAGYSNAVGFILGTGMNAAYFEKTEAIGKIGEIPEAYMAVNMEAAYFSSPPAGPVDKMLDAASRNRGQAQFEKMVSGAYLGEIAYLSILELAESGMISRETLERAENAGMLRIWDMTELIEKASGPCADLCADDNDMETLRELFSCVQKRAGKLTASLVAAVINRIRECSTVETVPVAVNGSTILLNRIIRDEFEKWLEELAGTGAGFRLISRDDDTLIGSAAAAYLE